MTQAETGDLTTGAPSAADRALPWARLRGQPLILAIGFAILLAVGAANVWLVIDSRSENVLIQHTLEVQNRLYALLLDLRRAESAQRGYILTSEKAYLEDFRQSFIPMQGQIPSLRGLISDNPAQVRSLAEIETLTMEKANELEQTVQLFDSGNREAAQELIRAGLGRRLMESIRGKIDVMLTEERQLFAAHSEDSRATALYLLLATLAGALMIAVLAVLSVLSVRRSNVQRDAAQHLLQDTNANLEEIVAERTTDLREANEEIQRFAYIVSHDLRSPLVNIMGFTSELEALRGDIFDKLDALRAHAALVDEAPDPAAAADEALGRDFDEALGFIKTSIAKMDRLINAILRLSREGRREFHPQPVDMAGLIRSISDSLNHQMTEAGASIAVGTLPSVNSDSLALEQVFSNLIDNALKYSKKDEPVSIEVAGRATPAQMIYEVSDNGRGIDPKDHQRIFELFRRSGTQDRPGEGIGLAHVRALVRRLGGSLTVKSELGRGSTFTVALPRRWTQNERKAA